MENIHKEDSSDQFRLLTPVKDYNRSIADSPHSNPFGSFGISSDIDIDKDSEIKRDRFPSFCHDLRNSEEDIVRDPVEESKSSSKEEIKELPSPSKSLKRKISRTSQKDIIVKDKKALKIISELLNNCEFDSNEDFRVKQTMQGFIISLFEVHNYEILKFDYIKQKISLVRQYLKRRNKYYNLGTCVEKSIYGALHSMRLFKKLENNMWEINKEKAIEFYKNLIQKQSKMNSSFEANEFNPEISQNSLGGYLNKMEEEETSAQNKAKSKIDLLDKFETMYQRLGGASTIQNPFENINPDEDIKAVWEKLGNNKMLGVLHSFILLRPLIKEAIEKEQEQIIEPDADKQENESKLLTDMSTKIDYLNQVVTNVVNRVNNSK